MWNDLWTGDGTLVVVVVLALTRIIKSVVTGQAPVTLELRNTPGKNTNNPRWYTHISQLTQYMPPPETYKSEIGGQSTMCQVHTGDYVSLLTPGETDYTDCHPSLYPPEVELAQHANHGISESQSADGVGISTPCGRYHVWMDSDPLSCRVTPILCMNPVQ